jgi:hypothetical protein
MRTFTSQAKSLLILLATILAMLFVTSNAEAKRSWLEESYQLYGTAGTRLDTCGLCHVNFRQNSALNDYGAAFKAAGGRSNPTGAFRALEGEDPDKDTVSSVDEIKQLFLPSWNCKTIEMASNAPSYVTDYVDPTNPGCWSVTGPAIAATPLSLDFGTVEVGANMTLTTTISNEGDSDLTVSSLSITGSTDFAVKEVSSTTIFTVAPGTSVDVLVDYTPGEAGDDVGVLEIGSDDPDTSLLSVDIAGSGLVPRTLVSDLDIAAFRAPKRLSLSREKPVKMKVVVVNKSGISGSGTVTLTASNASEQLPLEQNQAFISLADGERATLIFTYTPTVAGIFTWTATISDDDPDDDAATASTKVVP